MGLAPGPIGASYLKRIPPHDIIFKDREVIFIMPLDLTLEASHFFMHLRPCLHFFSLSSIIPSIDSATMSEFVGLPKVHLE